MTKGAHFVFGVGSTRSIMFIGDGPNEESEQLGEPFVGSSGAILRTLLQRLGLQDYYLTNLVACRSCTPQVNADGKLIETKRGIMYKDEPPIPSHCAACRPRLNEEIYIADPTVIVGLGPKACEALTGRPVSLERENGEARPIGIPGGTWVPELTDKGHWIRKVRGQLIQPVKQSVVRYHFVPTYHPRDVEKVMDDMGQNNVFGRFTKALRSAIRTHDSYLEGALGFVPIQRDQVTDVQLQRALHQEPANQ
jgi:uracil-DNA glycosylase family 4